MKTFHKLSLDLLISDDKYLDWFIYDDESLSFLTNINSIKEFESLNEYENIKFDKQCNIYFQDKLPSIPLKVEDYEQFVFTIEFNSESKFSLFGSITNTGKEIMEKLILKLKKISPQDCFFPDSKIIKFKSLAEYVWDINEPIGKFQYIVDCLKKETKPEFVLINKPNFENLQEIDLNNESDTTTISSIKESELCFKAKNILFDECTTEDISFTKKNISKTQNFNANMLHSNIGKESILNKSKFK